MTEQSNTWNHHAVARLLGLPVGPDLGVRGPELERLLPDDPEYLTSTDPFECSGWRWRDGADSWANKGWREHSMIQQ
jgi:hypothetical protein